MDYQRLFRRVQLHLESLNVPCELRIGAGVIPYWDIWDAKDTMKRSLPSGLEQFYLTMGNGLFFRWQAAPDGPQRPFANLQIPPLSDLAGHYAEWRKFALYTPVKAEQYGFPYTENPELAKRTAARMWDWLPVIAEGNGDLICVDLGVPSDPVIFHQHDWMDGGTGDNGHLLAENWGEFLAKWATVCFQFPKSLWWPSAFKPGGGVAWEGEQFRSPFRIASLAEGSAGA